jgi:hypothetical protein
VSIDKSIFDGCHVILAKHASLEGMQTMGGYGYAIEYGMAPCSVVPVVGHRCGAAHLAIPNAVAQQAHTP